VPTLDFYRLRFQFQALDAVHFPPSVSANLVRGAFGILLRKVAPPDVYRRLFEPGRELGPAPSGLGNWPRPFVFRTAHLDGLTITPNDSFDFHLFDLRQPALPYLQAAFGAWADSGIGSRRARARLTRVESLDVADRPLFGIPCSIALERGTCPVRRLTVRFVTPTELKGMGQAVERPEFAVLFARIRDRIGTLRTFYGQGPLDVDFRGMGERASTIALTGCELVWEKAVRRSSRTGQTHPLGGFTGEAEYQGALEEFLPWLQAARWTGVGRQTVWGKGEIHILRKLTVDAQN
jgi:hypothetical protein